MSDVVIQVRPNGPYLVNGPFQLVDGNGAAYPIEAGKAVALCRCGQSENRPFCDGAHRTSGFTATETAPGP